MTYNRNRQWLIKAIPADFLVTLIPAVNWSNRTELNRIVLKNWSPALKAALIRWLEKNT